MIADGGKYDCIASIIRGGTMMQRTTVLIAILTLCIACLCLGCTKVPNSEKVPEQNDATRLTEDIKEVIYAANKAAFEMCVQGFEEELKGGTKKPFAYYEASLGQWYSEPLTASLKSFYNDHLGEWGYEMGFAFPLHTREFVEEGFLSLNQISATTATVEFKVQAGHEEDCITVYTLKQQDDGSWLITGVE
jgi:hypothetical protein